MPNTRVPANAVPLPAITRRQLIMGTSASAASASAVAITDLFSKALPRAAELELDDELIRLSRMFEEAFDACDEARRRFDTCETRFFSQRPRAPKALRKGRSLLGRLLPARNMCWSAGELKKLLNRSVNPILRNEVRTALPLARAYEAEIQRLEIDTGLVEAEEAHGAAIEVVQEICQSIASTPARSVLGIAIKAQVVKVWGEPQWWTASDERAVTERLTAEILDAVIACQNDLRRHPMSARTSA